MSHNSYKQNEPIGIVRVSVRYSSAEFGKYDSYLVVAHSPVDTVRIRVVCEN